MTQVICYNTNTCYLCKQEYITQKGVRLDEIMTTKEAAKFLGMHPFSVTRLVRKGTLKGKKFGRDWLVYRESVEEFARRTEGKSKYDRTRGKTE